MKKTSIDIYYIGLFILALASWIDRSNLIIVSYNIQKGLYYCCIFLFILRIFLVKSYKKNQIFLISIFSIIILYCCYKLKNFSILANYLAIISTKNLDIKKIIKFLFIVNLIIFLLHFIPFIFIYLFNKDSLDYIIVDNHIRYYMFLKHPNSAGMVIFWTSAIYIFLNNHLSLLKKILILIIVSLVSYSITFSRTTLLIFVLYIILLTLVHLKYTKLIKIIGMFIFPIMSIICCYVVINYFNFNSNIIEILNKVNDFLTDRLRLSVFGYNSYGYTLFGKFIDFTLPTKYTINRLVIDCFYIRCLVNYGIIYIIFLSIGFYFYSRNGNANEIIYLILISLIAISENYIPHLVFVFPLLFLGKLFYDNQFSLKKIKRKT